MGCQVRRSGYVRAGLQWEVLEVSGKECWRCQARTVGGVRSVCVSGPERGTGQGASPQDPPAPTCVGYPPFGIFRYASKPGNDLMEKAHWPAAPTHDS